MPSSSIKNLTISEGILRKCLSPKKFETYLFNNFNCETISLPIIDAAWEHWDFILARSTEKKIRLNISIFQDEIYSFNSKIEDFLYNGHYIHILIFKKICSQEILKLKDLEKIHPNLHYTILINTSWNFEEVLKSIPFFMRSKISFNFENSSNSNRLKKPEIDNFTNRARQYLGTNVLVTKKIPLGNINLQKAREETSIPLYYKRASFLQSLSEIFNQTKAQLKAIGSILDNNPFFVLITSFYSLGRLFLNIIFPLTNKIRWGIYRLFGYFHLLMGQLHRVWGFMQRLWGYMQRLWGYMHRLWAYLYRLWGNLLRIKGHIVCYWWDHGQQIRQIYYVAKFHFQTRKEIPGKIILFLKKKKLGNKHD